MNLNKEISSNEITQAIKAFIFSLNLYKEKINNLNVFPVPDGDTGTNMLLTIKNIDTDLDSLVDIKSLLSHLRQSSLMEARGNSGVILSQFFQGLLSSYEVNNSFTISALAESFKIAAKNTRKSLPNPVDGTMMTVYEEIADAAHNGLDESEKFEPKKIEATGYLGMVVGYDYNGTSFENNEDWMLNDGYINLNVYLKFDNQVHELDLNDISKKLEKNNIEIDSSNSEEILSFLKNDILSNKQEEIQEQDIEEALNLYPDDMKMAAKSLNMDFKIFKEKVYSNILLKDKWVPELKNESEIIDLKKVNEIKKICEECLKNKISFTDWRDQFIEKDYNIDPYDSNKCIFKINFKKFNFYLGLMYRAEDKVDFIVDKYAGWS